MDNSKLTRLDRIEGLRRENGLTLKQLEERTGLSSSVLSTYENHETKDISHRAVITLAEFYGVTTDYLLGLVEQKNHPDAEVLDLHLSDEMIDILRSGKINNRLLCEIVTHSKFRRLLVDIEVYVDRIASMEIDNLNATVATARAEVLARESPDENDLYLRTLEAACVPENNFFTHLVHDDIDAIIADIREAHKKDKTTAEGQTTAAKLRQAIEDAMQFEGSDQEKQMRIYCNLLEIPYDDMPPEEFDAVLRWLRRSKVLQSVAAKSMRGKTQMSHGKGKRKKKS